MVKNNNLHPKYSTDCVVLGVSTRRESGLLCRLFCSELGLIYAVAEGAQKPSSKLRPSLRPYSRVTVELVRGKAEWRLTGAHLEYCLSDELRSERKVLAVIARIFSLFDRLVVGEEQSLDLFNRLHIILDECISKKVLDKSITAYEIVSVLNILYALGYLDSKLNSQYIITNDMLPTYEDMAISERERLLHVINDSLQNTHL